MAAWYSRLESLAILRVQGSKAGEFLQGQLSCDMRCVDASRAELALHCNPAGRVIADLLVLQANPQEYLLVTQKGLIDELRSTLARYAMFSRTQLDAASEWQIYGVEDAGELGAERLSTRHSDGSWQCSYPRPGLSLLISAEQGLPASLRTATDERTDAHWQAAEWRCGIVHVLPSESGQHTPQTFNYDHTGHVSFSKGCYTGQEVVARLHYRGKAKKRLSLWQCKTDCPGAGTLFNAAGDAVADVYASLRDESATLLWALGATELSAQPLFGPGGHALEPVSLPFTSH